MKNLDKCIIDGCLGDAKLIAKSEGRSYYSCDKHKNVTLQIIKIENKESKIKYLQDFTSKTPKWMNL